MSNPRQLVLVVTILCVLFYNEAQSWWFPECVISSEHFVAESNRSEEETREVLERAEELRRVYLDTFQIDEAELPDTNHQLRIYGSRKEFKRTNPTSPWAEAYYSCPKSHFYIDEQGEDGFDSMLHEVTHQLAHEIAYLKYLPEWINEGVACTFASCEFVDGEIQLDAVKPTSYPAMWLGHFHYSGDLLQDLDDGKLISVEAIVRGEFPISKSQHVNLYYIQYWSLAHYLWSEFPDQFIEYYNRSAPIDEFESTFGTFEEVQTGWYRHLLKLTTPPAN